MIVHFLFSLNYREQISSAKWDSFVGSSSGIPMFLFCIVSWCPYCRNSLPLWMKFEEEFKNNENIIVGTINCSLNENLCLKLNIKSFPTFLTHFHGDSRIISTFHDIESYRKIAKKLVQIQEGSFSQEYLEEKKINNNFSFPVYPTFVFSFPKDDLNTKELVSRAIAASDNYNEANFYFNISKDKKISVFVEKNVEIILKKQNTDNFTFEEVEEFMRENCHQLLGNWSFRSIRRISKKFVIFAYKPTDQNLNESTSFSLNDMKDIAVSYLDRYSWGNSLSMDNEERFNKIFKLKKNDYPSLIVLDIELSRFVKRKEIKSKKEITEFFECLDAEEGDSNFGPIDYEPLDVKNEMEQMMDLMNSFMKTFFYVFIGVIVFILIALILYFFLVRKHSFPKLD